MPRGGLSHIRTGVKAAAEEGARLVCFQECALTGYPPVEGPFVSREWPKINDFGVLQKYRRRGIGAKLMDAAEKIAAGRADTVCLSVGLHNGYGSAQRMYVKRGYIPDGSGAWYNGKPCTPYDTVYTNDDDLVLYMSKELREAKK